MPTARETVPNRALSGAELKRIIADDCDRLLAGEGLLSDHVAYGRVGYDLILRLHMDNPMFPESVATIASRPAAHNVVDREPSLAAVDVAPLPSPSADAVVVATRRSRRIQSPNAERLRSGMPVPVERKQQDGTVTTEAVTYLASGEDGDATTHDESPATREAWGLPSTAADAPAAAPDPSLDILCHCGHPRATHALSGICTQPHPSAPACEEFRDASIPLPTPAPRQEWQPTTTF